MPVWQHYMLRGPGFGHPFGRQVTEELLTKFYTTAINEPHKLQRNLSKVPNLLALFQDNHQALVFKLVEKYDAAAKRFFDVKETATFSRSNSAASNASSTASPGRAKRQQEVERREAEVARRREEEIRKQAEGRKSGSNKHEEEKEDNQENQPPSSANAESVFGFGSDAETSTTAANDSYDFFADLAEANGAGTPEDALRQQAKAAEEKARQEALDRNAQEVKAQKKVRKEVRKKEDLQKNVNDRKKELQRRESDAATNELKIESIKPWVDSTIYKWRLNGKGISGERKLQVLLSRKNLPKEVLDVLPDTFPDSSTSKGLSKCRKQILVRLHPDKLSKIEDFRTRTLAEEVTKIINMVVATEINK